MSSALAERDALELLRRVPGAVEALQLVAQINSWSDLETMVLRAGKGFATATVKSYGKALRAFSKHTGNLHPLQVGPAHVEAWFDSLSPIGTGRQARIGQLRAAFKAFADAVPLFSSPFDSLTAAQDKKVRARNTPAVGQALTMAEQATLRAWLAPRAATLSGVGKGSKSYVQECLWPDGIALARELAAQQLQRAPRDDDSLILTVGPGPRAGLSYLTLYRRVHDLGARVGAAGVLECRFSWSPHLMRYSAGSGLLEAGATIEDVRVFLRHSSLTTTQTYVHSTWHPAEFLDAASTKSSAA